MVTILEVLVLAIIQGATEWLPISSSGHLVLVQKFMNLRLPVFFDVVLHVGSLLVVLTMFRSDVFKVFRAIVHLDFESEDGKLASYVILGSIPTALIGFTFKGLFESFFNNLWAVSIAFIATGSFLFISERAKGQNQSLSYLDAFLIGTAQGIALIPGVSRSGITIATGLLRRVDKQKAFTYSFLLFIPAVIGATLFTAPTAENLMATDVESSSVFLGLATTMIVGYASLTFLLKIVLRGRLHLFAYYCWSLGFFVLFSQVLAAL